MADIQSDINPTTCICAVNSVQLIDEWWCCWFGLSINTWLTLSRDELPELWCGNRVRQEDLIVFITDAESIINLVFEDDVLFLLLTGETDGKLSSSNEVNNNNNSDNYNSTNNNKNIERKNQYMAIATLLICRVNKKKYIWKKAWESVSGDNQCWP